MSEQDAYSGPWTLPPVTGPHGLLKQRDLSIAAMRPGDDVRDVSARIRGYVTKLYVHPVARDADDARGALLFDGGAALTSATLLILAGTGLSSAAAMQTVAMALQSWTDTGLAATAKETGVRNPAGLILNAWRDNGFAEWTMSIAFRRSIETGRQEVAASIVAGDRVLGSPVAPREGWYQEAALVIVLDDVIASVARTMIRLRGAH